MTSKTKDHPFKNHQMPLTMRLFFSATTFTFKILGIVTPSLAGKLALRMFMTPPNFGIPRRERKYREEATLSYLNSRGRNISIRSWGNMDGKRVLLSHGWGGRCTQLHAFIKPLTDAGYRVIGFDVPGHGDSEGKLTNILDVASIISAIEEKEGEFEAIIGHSFGTGTALLAIDKFKVKPNKVILIAYFSDVHFIIKLFGELFSLRKSTLDSMQHIALKKFKNTYDVSWDWDEISPINTIKSVKGKLLLIHDKEDHEVPYSQALPLQQASPHAKTLITTGFGHRKILMNKECISSILLFISEAN
ncbi:MAG: alpha/beta fold hydrolase [Cocleimonas sp.]